MRTVQEESIGAGNGVSGVVEQLANGRRALFNVPLVFDLANGTHSELALQAGLERGFRCHAELEWSAIVESLEQLPALLAGTVIFDSWADDSEEMVLELASAVVHVGLERYDGSTPTITVRAQAGSRADARLAVALVREALPEATETTEASISVAFWYRGQHRARRVVRDLDAPAWCDVDRNYPNSTRAALEPLMRDLAAVFATGRLILWHGAPGTGKTTALRALARENQGSACLEYVLDPGGFFGPDAGYFVEVLFNEEAGHHDLLRVVVLEDCDDLLEADARNRGGQGLSRLLNIVDGLIGQGLRTAVLITTNEAVTAIHPALMRPGRCGALVEFELFNRVAARQWLGAKHEDTALPEHMSLADLLAVRQGRPAPAGPRRIGFETPGAAAPLAGSVKE